MQFFVFIHIVVAVVKNSSRYSFTKAYYDIGTALKYDVVCATYLKMRDIDDGLDTDVHDLSGTYLVLPKNELDRDFDDQSRVNTNV